MSPEQSLEALIVRRMHNTQETREQAMNHVDGIINLIALAAGSGATPVEPALRHSAFEKWVALVTHRLTGVRKGMLRP